MGDVVSWIGNNEELVGGLASAGASIYAADQQADAAQDAAKYSSQAASSAADLQQKIYNQNREDMTPWRTAGQNALSYLASGMGSNGTNGALTRSFTTADYQADPGYAFRLAEGQKALERSAAARGGLYSGRAAKDLTRYTQDYASNEYNNAYNRFNANQTNQYNRLASLAGVGQTANNAMASSGTSYANSVSDIYKTNATNQANSALTAANAMTSGYTGLGKALGYSS